MNRGLIVLTSSTAAAAACMPPFTKTGVPHLFHEGSFVVLQSSISKYCLETPVRLPHCHFQTIYTQLCTSKHIFVESIERLHCNSLYKLQKIN